MSRENVEAVRTGFERFSLDGEIWDLLDPEILWQTRADLPDSAAYRGIDGVRTLIAAWIEAFERVEVDVLETADLDDRVAVSLMYRAWMRGSADPLELPEAQVWRIRERKAVEVREYASWAEALAAMGRPSAPSSTGGEVGHRPQGSSRDPG